jgi:chromosome segregation ATPase
MTLKAASQSSDTQNSTTHRTRSRERQSRKSRQRSPPETLPIDAENNEDPYQFDEGSYSSNDYSSDDDPDTQKYKGVDPVNALALAQLEEVKSLLSQFNSDHNSNSVEDKDAAP